jgi:hypothetical protein
LSTNDKNTEDKKEILNNEDNTFENNWSNWFR